MIYRVLGLYLFFVCVHVTTSKNEPALNLAVQTEIQFDDEDLTFVDKVENFLRRLKITLTGNSPSRRVGTTPIKFHNFVNDLVNELKNLDDSDLQHVYVVVKSELKKNENNTSYTELRRYVSKIDKDYLPPANHIRDFADKLSKSFTNPVAADIFDKVYLNYSDKFKAYLDELRQYKIKSKRFNIDLSKIIRRGVKTFISERLSSLKESDRKNFSLRLNKFWNSNMREAISNFFSESDKKKANDEDISEILSDSASESSETLRATTARSNNNKKKHQRETTSGRIQTLWVEERKKVGKNMVEIDSDFIEDEKINEEKQSKDKDSLEKQSEETDSKEKQSEERDSKDKQRKIKQKSSSSSEESDDEDDGKIRSINKILRNNPSNTPSIQNASSKKTVINIPSKVDNGQEKITKKLITKTTRKVSTKEESSSKEISVMEHTSDVSSSKEDKSNQDSSKKTTKKYTSAVPSTVNVSNKNPVKEHTSKESVIKENSSKKPIIENEESFSTEEITSKEHVSDEKDTENTSVTSKQDITSEEKTVSTKKITSRKHKTVKKSKSISRHGTTDSVKTKKERKTIPRNSEQGLSIEKKHKTGKDVGFDIAMVLERVHGLESDLAMMKNNMKSSKQLKLHDEIRKHNKHKETRTTTRLTTTTTADAEAATEISDNSKIVKTGSTNFTITFGRKSQDVNEAENFRRAYKPTNNLNNNVTETTTLFEIKGTTLTTKQTEIVNLTNTEFDIITEKSDVNNSKLFEANHRRHGPNKTNEIDNKIELDNDVLTFPVNFSTGIEFAPFPNNKTLILR